MEPEQKGMFMKVAPEENLQSLEENLGYRFADKKLLLRCLTHVSYERGKQAEHNETLEFLGDAVLSLAVSDLLMRRFPDKNEGDLSKMRASLVNAVVLARKAAELKIGALVRIGKGEEHSGGREKESILAGAFEALLGGIYRERGYEAACKVVTRHFAPDIQENKFGTTDYKTRVQEIIQMVYRCPPTYRLVAESGPDHAKQFVTEIVVGGTVLGRGEGKSKKQSEQQAAQKALEVLQNTTERRHSREN
jgi:ribonuclease-3